MTGKNIRLLELAGYSPGHASHAEKAISALGGCVAILGVAAVAILTLGADASGLLVASMGASAVLLFAVPHGPLSQPWPLLGGHLVSALIGVTCAQFIASDLLAAGLAVGLAIGAMYYLHCIHPPGGATALSAVVGGEAVRSLGYQYVLTPVLLNVAVILLVAVGFNALFRWRRYPAALQSWPSTAPGENRTRPSISHEDFVYALCEIDSLVDVDEAELLRIYELAARRPGKEQAGG